MYKTQWCHFYYRSHGCRWGDRCYHAHDYTDYLGPVQWEVVQIPVRWDDDADATDGSPDDTPGALSADAPAYVPHSSEPLYTGLPTADEYADPAWLLEAKSFDDDPNPWDAR